MNRKLRIKSTSASTATSNELLVTVPDAFSGTEELKIKSADGRRLMRIEAEVGVIDGEFVDFLRGWQKRRALKERRQLRRTA